MSSPDGRLRRLAATASAWALPGTAFGGSALLASWVRHALVEHEPVAAACDAGQAGAACALRALAIVAFQDQRLGLAACALGVLALLWGNRGLALAGLATGGAGLVLYAAGPSAPAVLLSALAWLRVAVDPAKGGPLERRP